MQLKFDGWDGLGSCSCCLAGICNRCWLVVPKKEKVLGMIGEDFYVLVGGRHVGNRHCAMMRLCHNLVIRQFSVDGGGGSSFLEVVNRSGQRPGVGITFTIDGRAIIFRV